MNCWQYSKSSAADTVGENVFDPLLILNICPLTKKLSVYNFNGMFILTVRDRITTTQSRKMHFKKSYKLIFILMSEISVWAFKYLSKISGSQVSFKPGIHCDFSKVSTHTVREDRMRCKDKAPDLCARTIRSDCGAQFMCSHHTCEILGLRLRRRWVCIWTIARDNYKKKHYWWYHEVLASPINVLSYYVLW